MEKYDTLVVAAWYVVGQFPPHDGEPVVMKL